jgi:hypothetical protein
MDNDESKTIFSPVDRARMQLENQQLADNIAKSLRESEIKLQINDWDERILTPERNNTIKDIGELKGRVSKLESKNKLVKGLDFVKEYSSVWTQLGLIILFILAAMGYITIPTVTFK